MKLTAADHALLDVLCANRETRAAVFEHVLIGIISLKVNGKYVCRDVLGMIREYERLVEGTDP